MSSPAAAAAREDRRRGVVVDLVSPPGRRHAKLSFGSCISETPSPSPDAAAGASAGTCGHAAAGPAAAAEALSPARREACVCVITGLPAGDSRLAHKLQSCAQVTVSTLRAALHNALGRPLGSVCGETREALIREYCATLSSAPLAGADAAREAQAAARLDIEVVEHAPPEPPGECPARTGGHRAVGHSGTRPQSPRCEDSESDIDDLTSSPHRPARCTRSPRKPAASRVSSLWERTEATLRRSADGHDAGHGPADSAGEAAAGACIAGARGPVRPTSREPEERAGEVMPDGEERAGGHDSGPDDLGLWRRLERRRERDLELRAAEKAESHLPLWARLEARQQRAGASGKQSAGPQAPHLQQDTDDDNDDDIFAVRGGALSSGAGGAQGRGGHQTAGTGAAGAAQRAEVVGAGSDSDESIADLTCAETRVEDLRDQMAREVARLERERDEKVRKETAAAVAALDFEGAALLKRSIHADFQRKISAAQRKISAATGMCQQRARGEAGDRSGRQAAPAAAQVLSSKNSPKNKGGSAAAAGGAQGVPGRIFRNRSTHGGDVSAVRVGSAASGDMPKYWEMSVPDLKKAMSRYGLKPGSKTYMAQKLEDIWTQMHAHPSGDTQAVAARDSRNAGGAPAAAVGAVPAAEVQCRKPRGKGKRVPAGAVGAAVVHSDEEEASCSHAGGAASKVSKTGKASKTSRDAQALSAAVACLASHPIMDRMLVCECVSLKDVAAVLDEGGVKLSGKLLCHLLDQQGITHLAEGSSAVEAGGGRASASTSAAEDDEDPSSWAGHTGRRARRAGAGGCRKAKRSRYK